MTSFDTLSRPFRLLAWAGVFVAGSLLGAAAVVVAWAPWHTSAPPLATALPKDCPALLGLPEPGPLGIDTGPEHEPETDCTWGEVPNDAAPVNSTIALYPSIAAAQRASVTQVTTFQGPTHGFLLGADNPIVNVGDDARISDHKGHLVLVARKANVLLSLQYTAPTDEAPDQNESVLETAARTILDEVTVGP